MPLTRLKRTVAQLVEQLIPNQQAGELNPLPADATRAIDFAYSVPNIPGLAGITAAIQVFAADLSAELHASTAVEIAICL